MSRNARRDRSLVALAALLLLAGGAGAILANPSHIERDVAQERLDAAGAPLSPEHTLGQTFVSRYGGPRRIEFLAVVHDPSREFPAGARVCLDLERLDDPSAPPTTTCLPVAGITHNRVLTFDLPPRGDSGGATYRLTLRCDQEVGLSVWLTDYEAYAGGQAWEDGAPHPGDLYFRTFYDYRLTEALADLAAGLGRRAWPIVVTVVMLLVPGVALLMLVPHDRPLEPVVAVTLAVSLGMAYWPLLLLWMTTLGLRLWPSAAWLAVVLPAGAAGARAALSRLRGNRPARARADTSVRPYPESAPVGATGRSPLQLPWRRPLVHARDPWPYVALAIVMLLVVATRALQVRDLALPAWVDSVHHTMITRLIADGGRVPITYRPFMPVGDFHYHFGFHACAAALAWLSGMGVDQAVLLYGQALNLLAPLAAYTMAWWVGRSRWGGVAAALVVGALCYMPAYYVTWGRYTQLAGLDMLAGLMLATTWAFRRRRGAVPLAALLLAGLALTHYRVLVFYGLWAVAQGTLELWRAFGGYPSPQPTRRIRGDWLDGVTQHPSPMLSPRMRGEGGTDAAQDRTPMLSLHTRGEGWIGALGNTVVHGALSGALALFLVSPWVVGFVARVAPGFEATYGGWAGGEGGNAFPTALLNVGWTRPLLYLAAAGALWGLVRRRGEAMVTAAWVGLCLLAANLRLLGLPDTWLITNSAAVIAFWLPVGALVGWLAGDLGRLLAQARLPRIGRVGGRAVSGLLTAAVVVLGAVGSWRMVDIVNPVTVLATDEDVTAIAWARDHTPPGAVFLVNTGVWQAPMRYGTDAGWWLNVLADRRTTLSSLLYTMGGQDYFAEVNALAIAVEEAESVDDPALLERLRAAGVTHVFVGTRGGRLLPRDLDDSAHYRALYAHGPVRIYEVVYP